MRPFLSALLAVTLTGIAGVGPTTAPASAAGPSSADPQAHLADLYAKAAVSGRRFEEASRALEKADQAVERERREARRTRDDLAKQSATVADLTVRQVQFQTARPPILATIGREDPRDVLALWSAYQSTAEAMAARIDELSARQIVHRASQRRLERMRESQRQAAEQAAAARATINAAIAESKRATLAASVAASQSEDEDSSRPTPPGATPPPSEPSPGEPPAEALPPEKKPPAGDVSPADDAVWDRIAMCESGGNWHINTGNGYYGGLQFSERTWRGIGGPGLPHQHSREVQIHYAKLLQARYGWGQWSCAWARFP